MQLPEEFDLISVFGSIPKRKDETEPFYYDTSTFVLENDKELLEITISPFYSEFTLIVKDKETRRTISSLELLSVRKLEIVEDTKYRAKIRLFHGESDRYENVIELTIKPSFQIIFREQYR